MPSSELECDVLILGGGPAGLCAAWDLAQGGARVIVVEREESTGGLCRTHTRDGFRFDMGGHRFITADQALLDRVVGLLGSDLLLAERSSEVALLGRRFKYPLELPDLLRNLPPGLAARAVASWLRQRVRPRRTPARNFEEWGCERFGRVLFDLFIGPYTQKVWGVPPDQLSTEWATQRISFRDLRDVALSLVRRREPPRTCARSFLYPRLGMGQLFERIEREARGAGARVLTGSEPIRCEVAADRVRAVTVSTPGGPREVRAEYVLSTIPLPRLVELVAGREEAERLAPSLRFRPVRFLNLALDRAESLPSTWRYVGEGHLRAGRLQEPRKRSPSMAPPGTSSLMVEIPHAPGDAIDLASDAELLARIEPELRELGVAPGEALRFAFSVRAPEAYPVHLQGTSDARRRALTRLDALENLRSFGRQGAFRFIFSDAAMRMGLLAAQGVLAGRLPEHAALTQVASARTLLEVRSLVDERTLAATR